MISCIVYDSSRNELEIFEEILHDEAANLTADEWNLKFFLKEDKFVKYMEEQEKIDILCMEITSMEKIRILEKCRINFDEAKLLLITNMEISPMAYLRPAIHPDGLLLRPSDKLGIQKVIKELLQVYMTKVYQSSPKGNFTVQTRSGKTILPYDKISYFESRNKKIYLRAGRQEYGFYDTVEHLLEILPDNFVRCHRSFIVNKTRILKVQLSQNILELDSKELIPISRTYRTDVKNL